MLNGAKCFRSYGDPHASVKYNLNDSKIVISAIPQQPHPQHSLNATENSNRMRYIRGLAPLDSSEPSFCMALIPKLSQQVGI
jgi:hypothetical protein